MSRGGVLLHLERAMIPGAPVRVSLRLRHRDPMTLVGKIAWVKPHPDFPGWALGIQFGEELSGEMVAEIADEEYPPWAAPSGREETGSVLLRAPGPGTPASR